MYTSKSQKDRRLRHASAPSSLPGQLISYDSDRDRNFSTTDVFRMRADGTLETNLTRSYSSGGIDEPDDGRGGRRA